MQVEAIIEQPLFRSTHDALAFAFNVTHASKPTILGRLIPPPPPVGRGLGGLDGCAQAGMIKCEIAAMTPRINGFIITARFAVRGLPCPCCRPCCSGETPNPEWVRAIGETSDAVRLEALKGTIVNYMLRRIIVRRYFGEHASLKAAAEEVGVDRDTASRHAERVTRYLRDQEQLAKFEIEGRLKRAGIVE